MPSADAPEAGGYPSFVDGVLVFASATQPWQEQRFPTTNRTIPSTIPSAFVRHGMVAAPPGWGVPPGLHTVVVGDAPSDAPALALVAPSTDSSQAAWEIGAKQFPYPVPVVAPLPTKIPRDDNLHAQAVMVNAAGDGGPSKCLACLGRHRGHTCGRGGKRGRPKGSSGKKKRLLLQLDATDAGAAYHAPLAPLPSTSAAAATGAMLTAAAAAAASSKPPKQPKPVASPRAVPPSSLPLRRAPLEPAALATLAATASRVPAPAPAPRGAPRGGAPLVLKALKPRSHHAASLEDVARLCGGGVKRPSSLAPSAASMALSSPSALATTPYVSEGSSGGHTSGGGSSSGGNDDDEEEEEEEEEESGCRGHGDGDNGEVEDSCDGYGSGYGEVVETKKREVGSEARTASSGLAAAPAQSADELASILLAFRTRGCP